MDVLGMFIGVGGAMASIAVFLFMLGEKEKGKAPKVLLICIAISVLGFVMYNKFYEGSSKSYSSSSSYSSYGSSSSYGSYGSSSSSETTYSGTCKVCHKSYSYTGSQYGNNAYHNVKCITYTGMCKSCYATYCAATGITPTDY